jgi:TRAP-type C4-dicarboxylate transport system substrate-binding protein
MVLMNEDVWNSLSDGQKAAVDAVAQEVWEQSACCYLERDWAEKAVAALKDAGAEVITLDQAEITKMEDLTQNLLTDYAADLDSKGINGTEALNLLKDLAVKYNGIYPTND